MLRCDRFTAQRRIRSWICKWIDLLADGRHDEAAALLDEPNCYGVCWSGSQIVGEITEAYRVGTQFWERFPEGPRFSRTADTAGDPHWHVYPTEGGFHAEHDVPLNGEFSDLTAIFEFHWRGDELAATLHDMRVL